MDPTNAELYKLVLADAPYVIWAYGIIWLAMIGYVTFILRRVLRVEKEIDVLENVVEESKAAKKAPAAIDAASAGKTE